MRLLIVDDERLIIEDLITLTDWKLIGIDEIETALNVEQAKKIMFCKPVDIMLCDIEMPQASGLELLEWSKDNFPQTEVIILTCHAQFSYAQTALKLGSFDYLLKPVEEEELLKVIKLLEDKIRRKMREDESSRQGKLWVRHQVSWREKFWEDILFERIGVLPEEWEAKAIERNIPDEMNKIILPVLIKFYQAKGKLDEDMISSGRTYFVEHFVNREVEIRWMDLSASTVAVFIMWQKEKQQADLTEVMEGLQKIPFIKDSTVCIGAVVKAENILEEVFCLKRLMLDHVSGERGVFRKDEMEKERNNLKLPDMDDWVTLIENGKEGVIVKEITAWLRRGNEQHLLVRNSLLMLQHDLEQVLYIALQNNGIQAHEVLYGSELLNERLNAVNSTDAMDRWVSNTLYHTAELLKEAREPRGIAEKVRRYVKEHIGDDISRKKVADNMYLNPDYLDRFFKKETGMSVSRFIQMERVKMAKDLLNQEELSVGEIAVKCGYTNLSNFSAMFKRETGKNPIDYRKMKSFYEPLA